MYIKKRPIITWLLRSIDSKSPLDISISKVSNPINYGKLNLSLNRLNQIRTETPKWGLPELIMPSYEKIMHKSHLSFEKMMPELFKKFSETDECGILLCKDNVTLVYGFGNNELHLWYFKEQNNKSVFNFYSRNISIQDQIGVCVDYTILADDILFKGNIEQRKKYIASIAYFVAVYLAVKKYGKVETIIIPQGKYTDLEDSPLEYVDKKKIINNLGQEVIVMDSKWFRKIVNDNEIYVRGFWRMQNKKNEFGEWCKELIFVDPFIRHGYHRNSKIDDEVD